MNIALCSAFRNSTDYLGRYFGQAHELDIALHDRGDRLQFIWGEGDSTDNTRRWLKAATYRFWAKIVDCAHGGGDYGSVVAAERFKQLAHVGRCIWAAIPAAADVVVYIESDLIWEPSTIVTLIDHLQEYPAISPTIMLDREEWAKTAFYDTFAFRKDGRRFTHFPPYHSCYVPDRPFQVDSAGSCMAFRGDVAREIVFDEQTIFIGICEQIYANCGSVWVDPALSVIHR